MRETKTCQGCRVEIPEEMGILCGSCFENQVAEFDLGNARQGLKTVWRFYKHRQSKYETISMAATKCLDNRSKRIARILDRCSKGTDECKECNQRALCITLYDKTC